MIKYCSSVIFQLCTTDGAGFYQKTMNYFSDIWNQFDQISYYCMVLAVILRYTLDDDMFVWARMMYSITIILFFMRVLQAFYVEITMGPKVVMIKRMVSAHTVHTGAHHAVHDVCILGSQYHPCSFI